MAPLRRLVPHLTLLGSVFVVPATVVAQDALRLGVLLWHQSPNDREALDGIRNALRIAGRSHSIEVVEADSDKDKAALGLAKLRRDEVDLVFAMGTEAALVCKELVTDLPVVFTAVTNPVESGIVPDWKGSRCNLAGNSNWIESRTVFEVFRLAVPDLRDLGVLRSASTGRVSAAELSAMREMLAAPGAPDLRLSEQIAKDVDDLTAAVDRLAGQGVQAIWIPIDFLVYENIGRVAEAAARHRIPLVSSSLRGVKEAAVAGPVVDYEMLGERSVLIALDILDRHVEPGSIPIGRMAGYQLVVNLGAARRLGYRVPLPLLAVADLLLDGKPEEKR